MKNIRLPFEWRHLNGATVRLALSYLTIIMILSVSFSAVFYWTSTKGLDVQIETPTIQGANKKDENFDEQPVLIAGTGNGQQEVLASSSAKDLNKQLQERIAGIRSDLLKRLIALNCLALAGSIMLSLYMARRTLRPIEAAVEAQNRFASEASHELRTPLTILQTEIEVVLSKQHLSLARAKSALSSNYQEVVRLRQLSEGLLQLAHEGSVATGKRFTTIPLDGIVGDAVSQVLKLAQTKHIVVRANLKRILAKADPQSVLQILIILLDNAIKYSPKGSTITVVSREEQTHASIHIRDEGPGIPAADLPHIFERFYRANPAHPKQSAGGYGLGLSIATRLAEQCGGKISAESTPGKGSTFILRLRKD